LLVATISPTLTPSAIFDQIAVRHAGLDDRSTALPFSNHEDFTQPGRGPDGALRNHYGGRVADVISPDLANIPGRSRLPGLRPSASTVSAASLLVERGPIRTTRPVKGGDWETRQTVRLIVCPLRTAAAYDSGMSARKPERIDFDQRDDPFR